MPCWVKAEAKQWNRCEFIYKLINCLRIKVTKCYTWNICHINHTLLSFESFLNGMSICFFQLCQDHFTFQHYIIFSLPSSLDVLVFNSFNMLKLNFQIASS
jgi:hypothetical protein